MKALKNLILMADGYKYGHHKLYAKGTEKIYSYLESRGGKFDELVFFGLQYFIKEYLLGAVITKEDVDEAEAFMHTVFGREDVFDRARFDYIVDKHNGHLPIRIKAVKEGTVVPVSNVLMTIENTDPNCFWLSNFLETLLMQIWYPCTVATLSRELRLLVEKAFYKTAETSAFAAIDYVLNDFGFRGVSSVESAALGGAAHLLNFNGSDNMAGAMLSKTVYNANTIYAASIPATEHSICTQLGMEGELEMFEHVLDSFPEGAVACVSDSYDIFRACKTYWGEALKEKVLKRNGVLVIRPDSGDPVRTLVEIFEILMKQFGYTVNTKGYKVLPAQVRVIQGDGVNYESIKEIYERLDKENIAANNLVLGMGGALLQKLDRDTQKFALKCSYTEVNGEGKLVQKAPKEMDANGNISASFKKSKAGRLKLIYKDDIYQTVGEATNILYEDQLELVFENGRLYRDDSFETIKNNVKHNTLL